MLKDEVMVVVSNDVIAAQATFSASKTKLQEAEELRRQVDHALLLLIISCWAASKTKVTPNHSAMNIGISMIWSRALVPNTMTNGLPIRKYN